MYQRFKGDSIPPMKCMVLVWDGKPRNRFTWKKPFFPPHQSSNQQRLYDIDLLGLINESSFHVFHTTRINAEYSSMVL